MPRECSERILSLSKNANSELCNKSRVESKPEIENLHQKPRRVYGGFKLKWFYLNILCLLLCQGMAAQVVDWDDVEDYNYYNRPRRNVKNTDVKEIEQLIPPNYNFHEPPPTIDGDATVVEFSVLILNVRDIKEVDEAMTMEMNLRMYWKDMRLSHLSNWTMENGFPFMILSPRIVDKIWIPDIYIDHVKKIDQPTLITKPASVRVYPQNVIRYSSRITVSMSCPMDFHYYPADTQRCDVDLKSYAYTNTVLQLDWSKGRGAFLVDKLILPNFGVLLDTTQKFTVSTSSGTYAGLRFTVILRRTLSYHLIQTYLPSTLFIVVSWMSFLVPLESIPGRMALCMTTLLTLTSMFAAVRQNTPNVSYVKALDIWMVVCIIFVFLTLMEFTVVLKLKSMKRKPPEEQKKSGKRNKIADIPQKIRSFYSDLPSIQFRSTTQKGQTVTVAEAAPANGITGPIGEDPQIPPNPDDENGHEIYTIFSAKSHMRPELPEPAGISMGPTNFDLVVARMELITSIVVPGMFFVFNLIYWPWLLTQAQYYRHYGTTVYYHA